MKTKNDFARVEDYALRSYTGRHIRTATKIIFTDGSERAYLEKMSARRARAQLPENPIAP